MRRVLSGCQAAYSAGIDWNCSHCVSVPCEMDSSRSSIRIHSQPQHSKDAAGLGAGVGGGGGAGGGQEAESRSPRFPKLDECAHFHYEHVDLGALQVSLISDQDLSLSSRLHCEDAENHSVTVQVASQGKSWLLRRTYHNFRTLDSQLHRCIYDRKFSVLPELPPEDNLPVPPGMDHEEAVQNLLSDYLKRFSTIAGNLINCGPVLSWFELDNRGRRLLVPDNDSCPINTPAVAAAYSVKRYSAQAQDEISFEVGDMISVIDMPPPEESVWWRGKRGFEVGFFPSDCVAVIGDKVPRNLQLSAGSSTPNSPREVMLACQPSKPVLRKHGKLIAFFRSFILSRPSRRRLKQSGILKERVFGCDLGEHLLNSGHDIPMVLKCCSEFIETHGIVDGIYRLSGVTSNIQKLRNAFDEDRVPGLYEDEAILQDIHSVASLLKMYFRELPNPLCTYQLYHQFVGAVQNKDGTTRDGPDESRDSTRLMLMRDAVQKLPPPHYRTLQYLVKHLARVAEHGSQTGMTPRNVAIVWAPNLLRCKALEVGGVAALQGVGVQAVVTEFLICYADLIFCDRLPTVSLPIQQATPKRCRPKSLAISTPTKLLSLEEARTRALLSAAGKTDQEYIEVGGGPSSLPAKYHTVIDLPSRKRSGSKRSPLGWKSFFSKAGRSSGGSGTHSSRKAQQQQQLQQQQTVQRKTSTPSVINFCTEKAVTESDVAPGRRRLRPVKSAESLASGNNSSRNSAALSNVSDVVGKNGAVVATGSQAGSQAASPADGTLQPGAKAGHNRSVSHDSYFDHLAETPLLSRHTSSRLHEEEGFSSSLDLSEIQLNFELEESEMRIFSEDETLVSTFDSSSMMSQGSPHIAHNNILPRDRLGRSSLGVGKRLPPPGPPLLARPEDTLSGGCASLDPSPKKQKTSASSTKKDSDTFGKGDLCKRSRLEEQLATSAAELRYIDSQSPEQQPAQQQVLVKAEVHHSIPSPSLSSNGTYGVLASSSPSPAEAAASLSSDLTTPDTPLLLYSPLREEADGESSGSCSGVGSTPDYENMNAIASKHSPLEPRYEQLIAHSQTPSPNHDGIPIPKPRFQTQRTPYENIQRDFLAAEINASRIQESNPVELNPVLADFDAHNTGSSQYENMRRELVLSNTEPVPAVSPSASSSVSPSLSAGTTAVRQIESSGEDDTLEVSQDNFSLDLNAGFDHIYSEIMSGNEKENAEGDVCNMSTDSGETEDQGNDFDCLHSDVHQSENEPFESETLVPLSQNVYQNVPNLAIESDSCNSKGKSDDDVYEDFVFDKSDDKESSLGSSGHSASMPSAADQSTAELDPNVVYQQVKYLRRSIHEVNALLEDNETASGTRAETLFLENTSSKEESRGVSSDRTEVTVCQPYTETHFDNTYIASMNNHSGNIDYPDDCKEISCDENFSQKMHVEPGDQSVVHAFQAVGDTFVSQEPNQASEFPAHCEKPAVLECAATAVESVRDGIRETDSGEMTELSPAPIVKGVMESRRRFESEIGRELVRERRMNQELHEVRTAKSSPNDSPLHSRPDRATKSSVKELLSRFEATPMDSDTSPSSPMTCRRSDPHPRPSERDRADLSSATLPPCLRARAARIARTKLTTSTNLSASLDEDHFLRSGGSRGEGRALIRTQTEPDVNTENQPGSDQDQNLDDNASQSRVTENMNLMFSQEDDPQRRERIERYKEERRSFLRKKYRSESFKSEEDDTLARLKQKAGGKPGPVTSQIAVETASIEVERGTRPPKSDEQNISSPEKPPKDSYSPSKSPTKSRALKSSQSPTSPEPITCVTVRQRIVTPDKVSLKGCDSPVSPKSPRKENPKFGFSPEKPSADKSVVDRRFAERTKIPVSVELAQADRRPAQLVLVQRSSLPVVSSERRMSAGGKVPNTDSSPSVTRSSTAEIRRRASSDSNTVLRSPTKSPSYCIRDMAALFEAKESELRNSTNNACSKSNSSAGGKNCLSSA